MTPASGADTGRARSVGRLFGVIGPGRTTISGGLLGLTVAPIIAVALLPLPLALLSLIYPRSDEGITGDMIGTALMMLFAAFVIASIVTVVLAVPLWLVLRRMGRESGAVYGFGGALCGMAAPLYYLGPTALENPQLVVIPGVCALAGAIAALGFWGIARQRQES